MNDAPNYDIAVVVPLEEELAAFFEIFPTVNDLSTDKRLIHEFDTGSPNVSGIVTHQNGMGSSEALSATTEVLIRFNIKLVVCFGIAGAFSKDLLLGDVCYSGSIYDVLDNSSFEDTETDDGILRFSPTNYSTPDELTTAINFCRTQPATKDLYEYWQKSRDPKYESLAPSGIPKKNGDLSGRNFIKTHNGSIVCGSLSKSKQYQESLQSLDRKLLAIEMESGGVFKAAKEQGVPAINVRGISDYADANKSKVDGFPDSNFRELAASNAASFLKFQFGSKYFLRWLEATSPKATYTHVSEVESIESKSQNLTNQIIEEIREALNDLCPEYRVDEKDYRLPAPRIRPMAKGGAGKIENPVHISDVLLTKSRISIQTPNYYPDQSLPWVIAHNLIECEIEEKSVLPIVVNASSIRGKSYTIEKVSGKAISSLNVENTMSVIYILYNIPYDSNNKLRLIYDQIKNHDKASFLFISEHNVGLVKYQEFQKNTASSPFNVCPISFEEILFFVQKKFGMQISEASVIANRLKNTFSKFNISAHPTYFAGISKESLISLLQANRRSEFIQLAVDGFLSFVVLEDNQEVSLSRTTRSKFLRNLSVEINCEKINFDQPKLIEFTKNFAKEYDYDISPIEFIQSFRSHGILYFDQSDNVAFSLPFIERYLLAVELSKNETLASSYFQIGSEDFDKETFALYCEIGPSKAIVDHVLGCLDEISEKYILEDPKENSLFHIEMRGAESLSLQNIGRLEKRLKDASVAIVEGFDNTGEKQNLLDMNENIQKAYAGFKEKKLEHDENENDERISHRELMIVSEVWVASVTMLGAAAEHLNAEVKRELSGGIVNLGSTFISKFTDHVKNIDFQELKEFLSRPGNLKDFPCEISEKEKVKLISDLVDIIQYSSIGYPLYVILGYLCEHARQKVLSLTLRKIDKLEGLDEILLSSWLFDIDGTNGKRRVTRALSDLPPSNFLRITLANHYLNRVNWSLWEKEHRLTMLDVAEKLLQSAKIRIDKGKILRSIDAANV